MCPNLKLSFIYLLILWALTPSISLIAKNTSFKIGLLPYHEVNNYKKGISNQIKIDADFEMLFRNASFYCQNSEWEKLKNLNAEIKEHKVLRDIYHYFNGRIAMSEDRIGTARVEFENALKYRPIGTTSLLGHIYFYKALCLKRMRQSESLRNALNQAISNNFTPENKKEVVNLASIYLFLDQPKEAIELIRQYPKSLISSDAEISATLGRSYFKMGLLHSAYDAFEQSIKVNSLNPEVYTLKSNIARILGKNEIALRDIDKANALNPKDPHQSYLQGLIYLALGNIIKANNSFNKIFDVFNQDPVYCLIYAHLALTCNDRSKARFLINRYFEISKPLSINDESAILMNLLLNEEVPKGFEEICNKSPYINFRRFLDGTENFNTILKISEAGSITFFMAEELEERGDTKSVINLLNKTLVRCHPQSPEYLCAQWKLKDLEK